MRAHLFRRLRRWAGRRHVGFRRRVRGGGSGELHTIRARSDKWSWRRLKGEKDLPNLLHASVQSHPSTIPLIAYSSYVCSVPCLAAKINGCDAWPSQRSVLVRTLQTRRAVDQLEIWNNQGVFLTNEAPVVYILYFTGARLGRFPATGPRAILGHEFARRGARARQITLWWHAASRAGEISIHGKARVHVRWGR